MNSLQKKFVIGAASIFLLTAGLAYGIKSLRDLYALPIFYHLFARYDLSAAVLLIVILLVGVLLALKTQEHWVERWLILFGNNPFRIAVSVFIVLCIGAYFVYYRYPACMDEYMPYFQARIFAEGKLWGQFPSKLVPWLLMPGFFSVYSTETGRVVSDYWPGFALLLTPFMKLGVPWLLNPIISSGTVLLLFHYMRNIFPERAAASWGILLTIASSVFLINGISYYSMSAHLFLNLLYAVLLLRISPMRLFLAGVIGSFALVLHNPIPHLAFALPWIVWICCQKNRIRNIGALLAGYLPLAIVMGFGWVWLKMFIAGGGGTISMNYNADTAQYIQTQIGDASLRNSHLPAIILAKALALIHGVFIFPGQELLWARLLGWLKLFAWAVPGLPVLAILGIRAIKKNLHLKLWAWSAALTLFVFLFLPFDQGHGWGFRYFHSAWLALPLLAAAFLAAPELKEAAFWKKLIAIVSLLSLILCTGLRYYQAHQFIGQHLAQLPSVNINKKYVCIMNTERGYYAEDLIHNDPFLRDPVVLLRSVNARKDGEMMKSLFPGAITINKCISYTLWEIPSSPPGK